MTWIAMDYVEAQAAGALMASGGGSVIVFRSLHEVSGWKATDMTSPCWVKELADDAPLGVKDVVVAGEVVVSFSDPSVDGIPRRFFGLNLETGAVRWEREMRLVPSTGGLLECSKALFLHGFDLDQNAYTISRLDPHSGKTVWSVTSDTLTGAVCTEQAILLGNPDGIAVVLPTGEKAGLITAFEPLLAARGDHLYAHFLNDDKQTTFLAWQGNAQGEPSRAVLSMISPPEMIGGFLDPLYEPGSLLYAQYAAGRGVWRVDINEPRVAWNGFNSPESTIQGIAATPHGAIAWARQGAGFGIVSLKLETGLVQQVIESRIGIISGVFWFSDRLIITGPDQAETFIWKD